MKPVFSSSERWEDNFYKRFETAPEEAPLLGDSNWVGSWPFDEDLMPDNLSNGFQNIHDVGFFMGRFCIDRHNGAINIAFKDTSVRKVPLDELWSLRWHRHFRIQ